MELHYLVVPFDELVRRVEARNGLGTDDTPPITREMLTEYRRLFEPPDQVELALFDTPTGASWA